MSAGGPWLELLMTHYSGQFRDKFDVLVAFIHWCYVTRGFTGLGSPPSNFELTPVRVATLLRDAGGGTDLLPAGWNSGDDLWTLAYKLPTSPARPTSPSSPGPVTSTPCQCPSVILLKALRLGDELSVNVVQPTGDALSHSLIPTDLINGDDLTVKPSDLFKDAAALRARVMELFVAPILPASTLPSPGAVDARSDAGADGTDPYFTTGGGPGSSLREPRFADPLGDLGRADLDPFSGGVGGGMLFDPMRAGRGGGNPPLGFDGRPLPPGAIPPGARFDPFTPFGAGGAPGRGRGRGRGFGPDPDHDPPPGWDDMFM